MQILSNTVVLDSMLGLSANSPFCILLCYGGSWGSAKCVSSLPAGFLLGDPEEGEGEGKNLPFYLWLAILIDSPPSSNSWPQFSAPVGTYRMRLMVIYTSDRC